MYRHSSILVTNRADVQSLVKKIVLVGLSGHGSTIPGAREWSSLPAVASCSFLIRSTSGRQPEVESFGGSVMRLIKNCVYYEDEVSRISYDEL